jgi:hypothetical protein
MKVARHRAQRLALFLLVGVGTAVLAALAAPRLPRLIAGAGFVPSDHPWIVLDREITAKFGFENPVVWVVEARNGTVWTTDILTRLQEITRAALKTPGVIPTDVISIASPNMRDLEVTEAGIRPVYLMARVPDTPEAMQALRQRIDGDPNYRDTLVRSDGRAAMVVANFRAEADAKTVGSEARALRDRHRDSVTAVYVSGAPLVQTMKLERVGAAAAVATTTLIASLLVLFWFCGAAMTVTICAASLLAPLWTGCVVIVLGMARLPWSFVAVPFISVNAAVTVLSPSWKPRLRAAVAFSLGFAVMAFLLAPPARGLATAGLIGVPIALLAAGVVGFIVGSAGERRCAGRRGLLVFSRPGMPRFRLHASSLVILALFLLCAGVLRLDTSLGLAGYGQRYLFGEEASDLRSIARNFPPPTALAIRVRGQGGFVSSPAVLNAFDSLAEILRTDAAVSRVMSIADVVKLVNQAFNDKDPAFHAIPDDKGLITRYLTLAYSPGFRRFVDRALAEAVIWIYVRGDDATDLRRVFDRARKQLASRPVPDAEVDLVGGDGAAVLLMAEMTRELVLAGFAGVLVVGLILAGLAGPRTGLRAVHGSLVAAAAMAGTLGWLGIPLDLITAPLLVSAGLCATALASMTGDRMPGSHGLALALAVLTVPALLVPYAGAKLLGASLLATAVPTLAWARVSPGIRSRHQQTDPC